MATETPKLPAWADSLRQRMRERLAGLGLSAVRLLPRVALAGAVLLCFALVHTFTGRVAGLVLLGAAILVLAAWAFGQIPHGYRLASFAGLVALIAAWATQPHFGANLCPLTGFMWSTDFIEQVRPAIHRKIIKRSVQQAGWPPDGVTVAQFAAVADQAVDLLRQCVAERGVDHCRYAGSDPNGAMMQGYTIDGPNAIAPPDRNKYRYIKAGLDYEISMIPENAGGSAVTIRTLRFGKPLATGGKICDLGCWCNVDYGR